jgi:hypothetical protein
VSKKLRDGIIFYDISGQFGEIKQINLIVISKDAAGR